MATVEITVADPDLAAAAALFGAVIAIDLIAIRCKRATISRWVRHQYQHRPALTITATSLLLAHLAIEATFDPLRRIHRWLDQGDA